MSTVLSVNLNKVALLRNARGGDFPCVLRAAQICVAAGCAGLTLHPRPDMRHARPQDCRELRSIEGVELNLEGNPFEAARGSYPGFLNLVHEVKPDQCTLVPDASDQLTSDHGWDLHKEGERLRPVIDALRKAGIRSSIFVDAGSTDVEAAVGIGVDRLELYTGPYAVAFAAGQSHSQLPLYQRVAQAARSAGLGINAGHDLDQKNLAAFLRGVTAVDEVSIGHALIGEALEDGLDATVRAYLKLIHDAVAS